MSNPLDYVAHDEAARKMQDHFKERFNSVMTLAVGNLPGGRAQTLALQHLEEAYCWVGKAIRDDQIARNGSAPLQEGRGPG